MPSPMQRRNGRIADPPTRAREALVRRQATLSHVEPRGIPRCVVAGVPKPSQGTSEVHVVSDTSRLQHGGKTVNRQLIDTLLEKGHTSNCHYCGTRLHDAQMTLEHLCPTTCQPAKVPNNALTNLAISCAKCNNTKIPLCTRDCRQSNAM